MIRKNRKVSPNRSYLEFTQRYVYILSAIISSMRYLTLWPCVCILRYQNDPCKNSVLYYRNNAFQPFVWHEFCLKNTRKTCLFSLNVNIFRILDISAPQVPRFVCLAAKLWAYVITSSSLCFRQTIHVFLEKTMDRVGSKF